MLLKKMDLYCILQPGSSGPTGVRMMMMMAQKNKLQEQLRKKNQNRSDEESDQDKQSGENNTHTHAHTRVGQRSLTPARATRLDSSASLFGTCQHQPRAVICFTLTIG